MPIYEYQCANCHAGSEHLQKLSDSVLTVCMECQQPALVRLVSGAGFQLKGTGWYVTDFKNKPKSATKELVKPKEVVKTAGVEKTKLAGAKKND